MIFTKGILIAIIFLIITPISMAAVTQPMPRLIKMEAGMESPFKFQIQNINREEAINCTYRVNDNHHLKNNNISEEVNVNFKTNYTIVDANSKEDVYGSVFVLDTTLSGEYQKSLCTTCFPLIQKSGTSFSLETCSQYINVEVVEPKPVKSEKNTIKELENKEPTGIPIPENITKDIEKNLTLEKEENAPNNNTVLPVIYGVVLFFIIAMLITIYLRW